MSEVKAFLLAKTPFHVSNVNLKPENRGKKKKVNRMDIDGYVEVPADVLNEISREDTAALQEYLFKQDGDEKDNPRDTGLEKLPYAAQFNDHPISVCLTEAGKATEFVSKKIHKFGAQPSHSKHVKIFFQIQVYPTNPKEMWALSQLGLEPHYLEISAPAQQMHIEDKTPGQESEAA